jgi:uncharacterized protein YegJ (DUF2314 family)
MGCLRLFFGLAVTFLAFSALLADDKDKAPTKAPDIVFVPEDDKEMNAAMEKARKSVEEFFKVFQNPQKGQSDFGIKVAIRDGKKRRALLGQDHEVRWGAVRGNHQQ